MTIYALFVCSHLLGQCEIPYGSLAAPAMGVVPNRFASLKLCQEYSSVYLGALPDKRGRWDGKKPGDFWECLARHVDTWHEPGSGG